MAHHIRRQGQVDQRARNPQIQRQCIQGGKVDVGRNGGKEAAEGCHEDNEPFLVLGKDRVDWTDSRDMGEVLHLSGSFSIGGCLSSFKVSIW